MAIGNKSAKQKLANVDTTGSANAPIMLVERMDGMLVEREPLPAKVGSNGIYYEARDRDWSYGVEWNNTLMTYQDIGVVHKNELELIADAEVQATVGDLCLVRGTDASNLWLRRFVIATLECEEDDDRVMRNVEMLEAYINAVVESGTDHGAAIPFNGAEYNLAVRLTETVMVARGQMRRIPVLICLEASPKTTTPLSRVEKARLRQSKGAGQRLSAPRRNVSNL